MEVVMNVRADMQVREITTAFPSSLRQLERWGIDYCCGGGRPLEEACRRAGVPVSEVIAYVESLAESGATPIVDFRMLPLADIIDHLLVTHHAFTRTELDRALRLVTKVYGVHGAAHPELARIRSLVIELRDELLMHMTKEEKILFPYIETLVSDGPGRFGTIAAPIACMRNEHEDAGNVLEELRRLTRSYTPPDDACGSFKALYQSLHDLDQDLRVHIHIENDYLFPRALMLEMAARTA
jgi:regulator of cell morphogenesis and NO signaling